MYNYSEIKSYMVQDFEETLDSFKGDRVQCAAYAENNYEYFLEKYPRKSIFVSVSTATNFPEILRVGSNYVEHTKNNVTERKIEQAIAEFAQDPSINQFKEDALIILEKLNELRE